MKRDSIIDYWGCILLKLIGALLRHLPLCVSFFLGARLGELFYYLDAKHRKTAYANIKTAFGAKLSPAELHKLAKDSYRSFGQNLIEILLIPLIDKAYIDKYITFEGRQNITAGFHKGKGVILVAVHEGSWELSSALCAYLGFPFNLFIRQQNYPRLNNLLNSYRSQKGCRLIQKGNEIRELIRLLKNNEAVGMTVDQGGKTGTPVEFFGKSASMSTGALKLALRYNASIITAFYTRVKGPYVKVFLDGPVEIEKTRDSEKDIRDNLQRVINIFERYILEHPKEYLWFYKVWKYSRERDILILSDGKAGHLRQSQAIAGMLMGHLKNKAISANIITLEPEFKNKFSRYALTICASMTGKYCYQGNLFLRVFLKGANYKSLIGIKPDIVISCGSSVAPVNYLLAKENLARSVAIMRPSILSTRKFDLVVMSQHDRPAKRKNIAAVRGALNSINADFLREQGINLSEQVKTDKELVLGLLIGGDNKSFRLSRDLIKKIATQLKAILEKLDAQILITTSRRTPQEIEQLLKDEFGAYPRCKLLIIANEKNIPHAVAGILALSKIVITSPESISMISEAASGQKYVLVFQAPGLGRRHKRFLKHLAQDKYLYLTGTGALSKKVEEVWMSKPRINTLEDNLLINEALKKIA
ncbi:MAG: ELM1/GtrOC1 family putative glycosyltransferase [Candidatus Omnitrophica bacterium]|nr:ELM1/GtrOC1 family putative glycosyltransferase [Candidatus Omnitrophota bacterium]MDD5592421.1 ELM1/GtrOC1 family putative glycosyltransferase [Candidatus Omnitrophota bacterium]